MPELGNLQLSAMLVAHRCSGARYKPAGGSYPMRAFEPFRETGKV